VRVVLFALAAAALVPNALALAALIGLGVVRELPAAQVGLSAALLLVLPVGGLYVLLGRRESALVGAMWSWPFLLLLGLPGYFPGEVNDAMVSGFTVLAAAGGPDATSGAVQLARSLPRIPGVAGTRPPPEAERSIPECRPVAVPVAGDQVALPYEGSGHSMAVPVQFGEVEFPMLFDTGASVTTLDATSLRKLGVRVAGDAPEITLRTANGERTARLVLLDRVWVGGLAVDGVTVGVCEECADERTAGLLGLNVSGQFLVTVDTVRREVIFQAREGEQDRLVDVGPWLKVKATARLFPDERVEVDVRADNAAMRSVRSAEVGIHCDGDDFVANLSAIPARSGASTTLSLPRGTRCESYTVSLDHARW
jgi:clan AA aspartic protease (TIGR02281 family)